MSTKQLVRFDLDKFEGNMSNHHLFTSSPYHHANRQIDDEDCPVSSFLVNLSDGDSSSPSFSNNASSSDDDCPPMPSFLNDPTFLRNQVPPNQRPHKKRAKQKNLAKPTTSAN